MLSPTFQIYAVSEMADTARLSLTQVAIYLRLRCLIWGYTEDQHTCDWGVDELACALDVKPQVLEKTLIKLAQPPACLVVRKEGTLYFRRLAEQAHKQQRFRESMREAANRRWRKEKARVPAETKARCPEPQEVPPLSEEEDSLPAAKPEKSPKPVEWTSQERGVWLKMQKPDHRIAWSEPRRGGAVLKHRFKWVVAAYLAAQNKLPPKTAPEDVIRLTFGILRKGTPPDDALDMAAKQIRAYMNPGLSPKKLGAHIS